MAVDQFIIDPDLGDLYVVNGVDQMLRWDGFADQFEEAGMDPPATALTVSGSGNGAIAGTYTAYSRFVDSLGNVSNLSPISSEYEAAGTTGTITSVTISTPLEVTSAAHGLATGDWVRIAGVGGVDQANDLFQITVTGANTFTLDESDASGFEIYTGGGAWTSGVDTITYASVPVPTEDKAVRRQILRNTDGQADTYYVDVDTTDLAATTFSSTQSDSDLSAGEAVPILDADNLPFANQHTKSPSWYKSITHHLDRMFQGGLIEYSRGSASVVAGSPTVTGVGTGWKESMAGRYLYVDGASRTYQIDSVDEAAQTLTLTDNYGDATDLFATYSIKAPPAYRRVVQYTPAGLPQSWPPHMALTIQETGDELVGVFQMGAYVYIAERLHVHKFTFANDPAKDGAAFMVLNRGVVNIRSLVVTDAAAFMLDELGIHKFTGNSNTQALSIPIQAMFRTDEDTVWKVNWEQKEFFFATLDRQRETIRWFVCMDGNKYPKQAIAYQHRMDKWWVEDYPCPIGGACEGYVNGFPGTPQVYYTGQHDKVFAAWVNSTDYVKPSEGEARGTATSSGTFSLTDTQQSWPTAGMVNAPLVIVSGTGKGQRRRIVSVSGSTLTLDMPWIVRPDTTSVYQIGGIDWLFRTSWMRLADSENTVQRRFEMLFEPLTDSSVADMKIFNSFSSAAEVQGTTFTSAAGGGIATQAGSANMVIDLTRSDGIVEKQFPYGKDYYIRGKRYMQCELSGVSHEEQVKIYQLLLEGMIPQREATA